MFPFSRDSKNPEPAPEAPATPAPAAAEPHPLDALTGGAFSAATSGERAERVRAWLATDPDADTMQTVYKELAAKDRGAARAIRDRLDEQKRARAQDAIADEWREKGQALLDAARLHIADALAWQRDAAAAGAPLSRSPLVEIRDALVARVKVVEDLQQRVMVQREAAALLAQRIDLLSTGSWTDARGQRAGLGTDVGAWQQERAAIEADPDWSNVELRYPPQLEEAGTQLEAVWSAFEAALAQAETAAGDASAPLPSVPVWADELRAARTPTKAPAAPSVDPERRAAANQAVEAGAKLLEQAVTAGDTKNMHSATQALRRSLKVHGALIDDALVARVHQALVSAGELSGWQRWSADQLREQLVARAEALLKPRPVKRRKKGEAATTMAAGDAAVGVPAETAPQNAAPGQSAADAEAPVENTAAATADGAVDVDTPPAPEDGVTRAAAEAEDAPTPVPAETAAVGTSEVEPAAWPESTSTPSEGVSDAAAAEEAAGISAAPVAEMVPVLRGRKLQDEIRKLRDEWKTADRGGAPNQALWRRFDAACNAAYAFVEQWLEQVRAEEAKAQAEREALIAEVVAWTEQQAAAGAPDWKAANRALRRFVQRWRNGGHVGEKVYAELQPRWKGAFKNAEAPLADARKTSRDRRHAMIAEAEELGAAPGLPIAAIKDLQQRWQEEARAVPLMRKHEQKLWDAFRKPLDDAFKRRSAERDQQRARLNAHDQAVLDASKALEKATASGDAGQIRAAMAHLEAVTQGRDAAQAAERAPVPATAADQEAADAKTATPDSGAETAPATTEADATESVAASADAAAADVPAAAAGETEGGVEPPAAQPAPKPVVAVRGDDRPGARPVRGSARGSDHPDRGHDARRDGRRERGRPGARDDRRRDGRGFDRRGDRDHDRRDRGPRLGGAAFRAQRDAASNAQAALRELAAQAHGAALAQLIAAWQDRVPGQVPESRELGRAVTGSTHGAWVEALSKPADAGADAATALLRLELASETPTPADQLDARRALQLQLLTHRDAPTPAETWVDDTATVLRSAHGDASARRLTAALKSLLRNGGR